MSKMDTLSDPRRTIDAGRLNGVIHKTKRAWRKGYRTYCGKTITRADLMIMRLRPEDITCMECKELEA